MCPVLVPTFYGRGSVPGSSVAGAEAAAIRTSSRLETSSSVLGYSIFRIRGT